MTEKYFEGAYQDLKEAEEELNNLKLVEKTLSEFFQNQVEDLLEQKGFRNFGDIFIDRPYGSTINICFHLSEVEEARLKMKTSSYLPSLIAEGNLKQKQIKFSSLKDKSPETHPPYIKEEIIPFLHNTFQKLGFYIEMEEPEV